MAVFYRNDATYCRSVKKKKEEKFRTVQRFLFRSILPADHPRVVSGRLLCSRNAYIKIRTGFERARKRDRSCRV